VSSHVLIGSALVIAAILSTRFAQRMGVPALVLLVGIGILAGSSGPGGIVVDDYALSLNVGLLALAVILLSGGLDTDAEVFREALAPAGLLAWAGLKGAVPIILAVIPLLNQVPSGPLLFTVTFVCVVVGKALQGATIAPLALRMGLSEATSSSIRGTTCIS